MTDFLTLDMEKMCSIRRYHNMWFDFRLDTIIEHFFNSLFNSFIFNVISSQISVQ